MKIQFPHQSLKWPKRLLFTLIKNVKNNVMATKKRCSSDGTFCRQIYVSPVMARKQPFCSGISYEICHTMCILFLSFT